MSEIPSTCHECGAPRPTWWSADRTKAMCDAEWISRAQWQKLLRVSRELLIRIDSRKRQGLPVAGLWDQLRPINQRIRSPKLQVFGIDDRSRGDHIGDER